MTGDEQASATPTWVGRVLVPLVVPLVVVGLIVGWVIMLRPGPRVVGNPVVSRATTVAPTPSATPTPTRTPTSTPTPTPTPTASETPTPEATTVAPVATPPPAPATTAAAAPRTTQAVKPPPPATQPAATQPPATQPAQPADQYPVVDGWRQATLAQGPGPISVAVRVESGLAIDPNDAAAFVLATLNDPRGWAGKGYSFSLVPNPSQARIVISIASPGTVDRLCYPLTTAGYVSCTTGRFEYLNVNRWTDGVPWFTGVPYRQYLVSHETGHALGYGHVGCPGAGLPAPVMMQQTYGVGACYPNPWVTIA